MKKEKKEWKGEVSRQISVYKNQSALLELNNCMRPACSLFPWHIHAQGEEGEEGYSLIRAVMLDYSKKDSSISVFANLSPELVKYLFAQMQRGVEEFFFAQQKIFHDRDVADVDAGIVTCFSIKRNPFDSAGNERRMPWQVEIQNGTGRIAHNRNGGQFCEKGTYRKERSVLVSLKDEEIFMLFARADAVIRAFEQDSLFRKRNANNFRKLYQMLETLILEKQKEKHIDKAA